MLIEIKGNGNNVADELEKKTLANCNAVEDFSAKYEKMEDNLRNTKAQSGELLNLLRMMDPQAQVAADDVGISQTVLEQLLEFDEKWFQQWQTTVDDLKKANESLNRTALSTWKDFVQSPGQS